MSFKTVGIVGTGSMGRAAAAILCESFELCVYDVSDSARVDMQKLGYQVYASPREVAEKADAILLFLPGPPEVAETVTGENGLISGLQQGSIIVDLSTVEPEGTKQIYQRVVEAGGNYLDAPILGRPDRSGRWTLPVGGDENALEQAMPVLSPLATRVMHVGPSGSGNVVKLLNNLMFGAINNVTAEVLSAASRLGVSPKVVFDTISESGAATVSGLFKSIGPKIVEKDFTPVFRVELLYKDMDLGIKMAKAAGATLVVSEGAQKLTEIALARGYKGMDSSVVTRVSDLISEEVT